MTCFFFGALHQRIQLATVPRLTVVFYNGQLVFWQTRNVRQGTLASQTPSIISYLPTLPVIWHSLLALVSKQCFVTTLPRYYTPQQWSVPCKVLYHPVYFRQHTPLGYAR